jgi:hypothetical protein
MALKTVLLVLLVGLFNNCNHHNSKNTPSDKVTTPTQLPDVDQIKGKSFKEAEQLLGTPKSVEEFYFGEAILGEFRITLLNFFNQKDSTDRQKLIKEATWQYGKEMGQIKYLTVWFVKEGQQWKFLELTEYLEGDEF